MMFSIIVPVYCVENYIEKCLVSIQNQSYSNFEVIVVNDGSLDGSQSIIDEFVKRDSRFLSYRKENGGLSDARNYGVSYANGDYIIFIDSDDYLECDLLMEIDKEVKKHPDLDLIRYQAKCVCEDGSYISTFYFESFSYLDRDQAILQILKNEAVEPAWLYAYRSDFFKSNQFQYPFGRIHEDFGLTPYILSMAKKISSLSYVGLNYVQRQGSIMNSDSLEKRIKKAEDVCYHFEQMVYEINANSDLQGEAKDMLFSYMANCVLLKCKTLTGDSYRKYMIKLRELHILDYLVTDTWKRKLKKIWLMGRYHL